MPWVRPDLNQPQSLCAKSGAWTSAVARNHRSNQLTAIQLVGQRSTCHVKQSRPRARPRAAGNWASEQLIGHANLWECVAADVPNNKSFPFTAATGLRRTEVLGTRNHVPNNFVKSAGSMFESSGIVRLVYYNTVAGTATVVGQFQSPALGNSWSYLQPRPCG